MRATKTVDGTPQLYASLQAVTGVSQQSAAEPRRAAPPAQLPTQPGHEVPSYFAIAMRLFAFEPLAYQSADQPLSGASLNG
jgi:hypothetical protein